MFNDLSVIYIPNSQSLLVMIPTNEERKLIKGYTGKIASFTMAIYNTDNKIGDPTILGKAEKFFYSLLPFTDVMLCIAFNQMLCLNRCLLQVQKVLECFIYKIEFDSTISDMTNSIESVIEACKQVKV